MDVEEIEIVEDQITIRCDRCGLKIGIVSVFQHTDTDEVEIKIDPHLCSEYQPI